jgi:hypothetical protein
MGAAMSSFRPSLLQQPYAVVLTSSLSSRRPPQRVSVKHFEQHQRPGHPHNHNCGLATSGTVMGPTWSVLHQQLDGNTTSFNHMQYGWCCHL